MRRWPWLLSLLALVLGQSYQPTATLVRKGHTVTVVKTSPDSMGLFFIEQREIVGGVLKAVNKDRVEIGSTWYQVAFPEKPPSLGQEVWVEYLPQGAQEVAYRLHRGPPPGSQILRIVIYDPPPYRVTVHFDTSTLAYGALAVVRQIRGGPESIELTGGQASYDAETNHLKLAPQRGPKAVEIVQGASQAFGQSLLYDNQKGLAYLKGPVDLQRSGEHPLQGSAQQLIYHLSTSELTLIGQVHLEQGGRVTQASSALLINQQNLAYLYGNPVTTKGQGEEVEGKVVRYNLDNGDVLVLEGVQAVFNHF